MLMLCRLQTLEKVGSVQGDRVLGIRWPDALRACNRKSNGGSRCLHETLLEDSMTACCVQHVQLYRRVHQRVASDAAVEGVPDREHRASSSNGLCELSVECSKRGLAQGCMALRLHDWGMALHEAACRQAATSCVGSLRLRPMRSFGRNADGTCRFRFSTGSVPAWMLCRNHGQNKVRINLPGRKTCPDSSGAWRDLECSPARRAHGRRIKAPQGPVHPSPQMGTRGPSRVRFTCSAQALCAHRVGAHLHLSAALGAGARRGFATRYRTDSPHDSVRPTGPASAQVPNMSRWPER
ncbi:hypothetical protein PSPO01_02203 [Paraphaeosphaeria sporulosa]